MRTFLEILYYIIEFGIVFFAIFIFAFVLYIIEWMLFIWNRIHIFTNKLKKRYDKVFHSISKVQKRERQR